MLICASQFIFAKLQDIQKHNNNGYTKFIQPSKPRLLFHNVV